MIAILGGGMAGLAAAYKLDREDVIILEKEKEIGGLASSFKFGKENIPVCYHHILHNDYTTFKLVKELNITNSFYKKKVPMAFFYNNKICRLSTPLDLIKFKPLGFFDRIRAGLFALKIFSVRDWSKYNNINARDWIIRNTNYKVYKTIFEPLLKTKFTKDYNDISAEWVGYRLSIGENKGEFGYFNQGLNLFVNSLKNKIKGKIITNAKIEKVVVKNNKVIRVIYIKNNKKYELKPDKVICTLPIPVMLNVFDGLSKSYVNKLKKVKYKASISVVIALNKKLMKYYWLNLLEKKYIFDGIFDHTVLNPGINNENSLLYLFTYLDIEDKLWNMDNDKLKEKYIKDLNKMFNLNKNNIKLCKIFKLKYSKPVYFTGYREFKPTIDTPIDNLFLAGIGLFPKIRNIGTALYSGIKAAEKCL